MQSATFSPPAHAISFPHCRRRTTPSPHPAHARHLLYFFAGPFLLLLLLHILAGASCFFFFLQHDRTQPPLPHASLSALSPNRSNLLLRRPTVHAVPPDHPCHPVTPDRRPICSSTSPMSPQPPPAKNHDPVSSPVAPHLPRPHRSSSPSSCTAKPSHCNPLQPSASHCSSPNQPRRHPLLVRLNLHFSPSRASSPFARRPSCSQAGITTSRPRHPTTSAPPRRPPAASPTTMQLNCDPRDSFVATRLPHTTPTYPVRTYRDPKPPPLSRRHLLLYPVAN